MSGIPKQTSVFNWDSNFASENPCKWGIGIDYLSFSIIYHYGIWLRRKNFTVFLLAFTKRFFGFFKFFYILYQFIIAFSSSRVRSLTFISKDEYLTQNSSLLNFSVIDLTESGKSLSDMHNKLTLGCLPGQKREIKTLLGSDSLTGL